MCLAVAVGAKGGNVVEAVIRGVLIDMVELNEGRLANTASVIRFAQNLGFKVLWYWLPYFQRDLL